MFFSLLLWQVLSTAVANEFLTERFAYYSLKLRNISRQSYSSSGNASCDYFDVCESDMDKIVFTNDSDIFPPFQVNTSIVAHKLTANATVANEINEICFATSLNDEWEAELRDDQYGALAWQYLGFSTEGTYSYFPLSNWSDTNSCPGSYDPRQRAWYLSAISGPLTVMIMIDTSTTEDPSVTSPALRLTRQKEAAFDLLHSLNYWSFFNIGLYADDVSFFGGNTMLRATADNIARAETFLNNVTLAPSKYVALEHVLDQTLEVIVTSENDGASSACHTMLLFLSSDHNDLAATSDVSTIVNSYDFESGYFVVLSFVFNFDGAVVDPIYEELSCLTFGFDRIFTDSSSAGSSDQVIALYSSYLAATLEIDNVRYSEIYVDALGLGELTTGAVPLYETVTDALGISMRQVVGVYGIDLLVTSLNNGGTISNADIMASLAAISKCPKLTPTDEILLSFREGSTCDITSATVSYGDGGEHPLEEDKYIYDIIGSLGLIGSLAICLLVILFYLENEENHKWIGAFAVFILHASFGIALVAYCLHTSWDDAVVNKYWKDATATVLSTVIDPSVCCDTVNCACLDNYGYSCPYLVSSYQEGLCDNGYYCCQSETYDCNCHYTDDGGEECDTCTRCIASVNHQQCEVVCEECYTGKVIWSYTPENRQDPVILEYSQHCNEGQASLSLQCAEAYVAQYPAGSQHAIIYNPLNLLETKQTDKDLPGNYYIVIISMALMLSVSYCIVGGLWYMQADEEYSTKNHQDAHSAPAAGAPAVQQMQQYQQQLPPSKYHEEDAPQQYQQQPYQQQYQPQQQSYQQIAPPVQQVQLAQFVSRQQAPPPQQYGQVPSAPSKYQEEDAPPAYN